MLLLSFNRSLVITLATRALVIIFDMFHVLCPARLYQDLRVHRPSTPSWWRHIRKNVPGELWKISRSLRGNFRICEYIPWCSKYEGLWRNMRRIWRSMSKICRNMKKYVNILDLALPYQYGSWDLEKFQAPPSYSLWDALGLRKIPRPSFLLDSGTWKNSQLCLYTGSGIWKNVELSLPPITACWRGVTLLSSPYKL